MRPAASLLACALATLATIGSAAAANAAESKVDPELLEFLGAFESEDDEFLDFLEQRPVKPPAKKPEAAAKPADPKQVKKS